VDSHWYTDSGGIKPELLNEEAEKIAASLVRDSRRGDRKEGVTSSQLRRLYGEVKDLERRLDEGQKWEKILPLVKLLKAKVAYTVGRAIQKSKWDRREYENLQRFLETGIDAIESKEDFLAFCKQFEAVVGYYYGITKGSV